MLSYEVCIVMKLPSGRHLCRSPPTWHQGFPWEKLGGGVQFYPPTFDIRWGGKICGNFGGGVHPIYGGVRTMAWGGTPIYRPKHQKRGNIAIFFRASRERIPIFSRVWGTRGQLPSDKVGGVQIFSGGVNVENPVGGGVYPPTTPPVGETLHYISRFWVGYVYYQSIMSLLQVCSDSLISLS